MDEHDTSKTHHGFVMVDIGEEAGALIVHTGSDLQGIEIEISPAGMDEARQHVAILQRMMNGRSFWAAVFPSLAPGVYSLWRPGRPAPDQVSISAATITEVDWR
jgi:hypothetical protein